MTPAQAALKEYLLAKFSEGVFANTKGAASILKKASAEFAIDLPIAVSSLLSIFSDNVLSVLGQEILHKASGVARDMQKRGVKVVLTEVTNGLDMQYARGVERNRKR